MSRSPSHARALERARRVLLRCARPARGRRGRPKSSPRPGIWYSFGSTELHIQARDQVPAGDRRPPPGARRRRHRRLARAVRRARRRGHRPADDLQPAPLRRARPLRQPHRDHDRRRRHMTVVHRRRAADRRRQARDSRDASASTASARAQVNAARPLSRARLAGLRAADRRRGRRATPATCATTSAGKTRRPHDPRPRRQDAAARARACSAAKPPAATRRAPMPAAVALELVHNFTLIHDDIEDNSETRHGRATLWKRRRHPAGDQRRRWHVRARPSHAAAARRGRRAAARVLAAAPRARRRLRRRSATASTPTSDSRRARPSRRRSTKR